MKKLTAFSIGLAFLFQVIPVNMFGKTVRIIKIVYEYDRAYPDLFIGPESSTPEQTWLLKSDDIVLITFKSEPSNDLKPIIEYEITGEDLNTSVKNYLDSFLNITEVVEAG